MKLLLVFTFLFPLWLYPQYQTEPLNQEVTLNGRKFLYGKIDRSGLNKAPYRIWFNRNYMAFSPDIQKLSACNEDALEGVTVKLLMATWCPDSKRDVPIFFKIMDTIGLPDESISIWSLDFRKRGPKQEQVTYGVTRVPTIIFYRDNREIGRFIERLKPRQRMEDIFLKIITG